MSFCQLVVVYSEVFYKPNRHKATYFATSLNFCDASFHNSAHFNVHTLCYIFQRYSCMGNSQWCRLSMIYTGKRPLYRFLRWHFKKLKSALQKTIDCIDEYNVMSLEYIPVVINFYYVWCQLHTNCLFIYTLHIFLL